MYVYNDSIAGRLACRLLVGIGNDGYRVDG